MTVNRPLISWVQIICYATFILGAYHLTKLHEKFAQEANGTVKCSGIPFRNCGLLLEVIRCYPDGYKQKTEISPPFPEKKNEKDLKNPYH